MKKERINKLISINNTNDILNKIFYSLLQILFFNCLIIFIIYYVILLFESLY
jgi:hypothetical protein